MKRSELKEAIKAEIKSVLSEGIKVGDMVTIGDGKRKYEVINVEKGFMSDIDDVEVKSTDGMPIGSFNPNVGSKTATYKATQLRLAEIAPMGPGQTTKLADLEDEDLITVSKTEFENQFDQLEGGYIEIEDFLTAVKEIVFGKIAPRGMMREDEMTDAEKRKAAEKDAKKEKKFAGKQKEAEDLKTKIEDKKAEMVKKAKEYKAAEGEKKEKIKDQLKKMTAERDELNKQLEKLKKVEI